MASLRSKAARGVVFLALRTGFKLVIAVGRLAVLARLLTSEAFGLFGLAMVLVKGLEVITNVGSDKHIVQKEDVSAELIGAAWTFNLGRGVAVSVLALAFAPFYARMVVEPHAFDVLAVVAFSSAIKGLKSPGTFLAERDLHFGKIAIFEVGMIAIEAVSVVACVYFLGGALGLAWGFIGSAIASVVLSFALFPMRFRPRWSGPALRELFGVGKHFVIISVGSFLMVQGDNFIVGATLGSAALGFYVIAYRLVDLPLQFTFPITNRVAFPVLSRVKEDDVRLRRGFLVMMDLQLAILMPSIVFVVAFAEPLVITLYGAKWLPCVEIVQAFCLIMAGRGISHIVVPLILAKGDYDFASRVKLVETGVFLVATVAGAYAYGTVGAALGAGLGYMTAAAARLFYAVSRVGVPAGAIAARMGVASGICVLAVAGTVGLLRISASAVHAPAAQLAVAVGCFGALYAVMTLIMRPAFVRETRHTIGALRTKRASVTVESSGTP